MQTSPPFPAPPSSCKKHLFRKRRRKYFLQPCYKIRGLNYCISFYHCWPATLLAILDGHCWWPFCCWSVARGIFFWSPSTELFLETKKTMVQFFSLPTNSNFIWQVELLDMLFFFLVRQEQHSSIASRVASRSDNGRGSAIRCLHRALVDVIPRDVGLAPRRRRFHSSQRSPKASYARLRRLLPLECNLLYDRQACEGKSTLVYW